MDTNASNSRSPGAALYAGIAVGLGLIVAFVVLLASYGGLPGTTNSPNATVGGQSTTGRTAAD
jgi:hypothetical protein